MLQKQTIRKHLEQYGTLTGAKAFTKYNVYRLSEYIRRLRADGMEISTIMETDKNTGKEYGVYVYQGKKNLK